MRQKLAMLVILCLCLSVPGRPAMADQLLGGSDNTFNLAIFTVGTIGTSLLAYYLFNNSPAAKAKAYQENLGLGEWYVAGYAGVSYLPHMDWKIATNGNDTPPLGPIAKNMTYRPGPQVGIKFGRYFDALPWFGMEAETNFSRNIIPGNQGRISPPLVDPRFNVPTRVLAGSDWFMIWAMQVNFLARYGLLKDKEVPFGRLQPYLGIGPGWEIVYGRSDSTKNLAIEGLAGIRYMCTDKISLFFEYKYSYQFNIEYQDVHINKTGAVSKDQSTHKDYTFIMNFPHHRFVLGVAYHFKNFFGN